MRVKESFFYSRMKGQTEGPVLFSCEKLEKVKEELLMRDFSNQSSFSRTLYNDAKLGAYYTDAGHTERMGRMIRLLGETSVLEPCCGDASALAALLKTVADKEIPRRVRKVPGVFYEKTGEQGCVLSRGA